LRTLRLREERPTSLPNDGMTTMTSSPMVLSMKHLCLLATSTVAATKGAARSRTSAGGFPLARSLKPRMSMKPISAANLLFPKVEITLAPSLFRSTASSSGRRPGTGRICTSPAMCNNHFESDSDVGIIVHQATTTPDTRSFGHRNHHRMFCSDGGSSRTRIGSRMASTLSQ